MRASRFLLYPAWGGGKGSGHLRRMSALARSLAEAGAEAFLCGPGEAPEGHGIDRGRWIDALSLSPGSTDLVLADRFRCSPSDLDSWRGAGLRVGLDEGGRLRGDFDYLIDVLPGPRPAPPANLGNALGFLDLPPLRRGSAVAGDPRILVSFGGEDGAGLGPATVKALLDVGIPADRISYLRGMRGPALPGSLKGPALLENLPKLAERIHEWDIVFTQYGLTAWEALAAGCDVVLAHPSLYHRSLARAARIPSLKAGPPRAGDVAAILSDPKALSSACEGLRRGMERERAETPGEGRSGSGKLASFLLSMELPSLPPGRHCVSCRGRRRGATLWRDALRSYRRCPACGSVSMSRFQPNPISYDKEYFFEEYRLQYGKTYLEDFPVLQAMADRRLDRIASVAGRPTGALGLRVLDLGCAYGAFLERARERGCEVFGVEPAKDAVRHCREILGMDVSPGAFPSEMPSFIEAKRPFDLISLWYVIEHLVDIDKALQDISGLLRRGGVLAFSTPSCAGVSARFSPDSFWRSSPLDHTAVLDPRSLARVLKPHGFRLVKTLSTGHHPERFPGHPEPGSPGFRLRGAQSRLLSWGDTFEAYAVLERP